MFKNQKKIQYNKQKDLYFTKPEVAKQCIQLLGDLSIFDLIIEPSAGY